jgi:malonyl-CoA O-methyltransferase
MTAAQRIQRIPAAEGYRIWAESYDRDLNPILELERRVLGELVGDVAGRTALDAGCGTGRWAAEAAARGARAFGIDLSAGMLSHARDKGLSGRLAIADMRRLPIRSETVDLAILSFALSYVEDAAAVLRETARVTRPGAVIALGDFHPAAVESGWKRTFRRGAEVFELESFAHTRAVLQEMGRALAWQLEAVAEPCLGEPERDLMRKAGREDLYEQAAGRAAVLIMLWRKP